MFVIRFVVLKAAEPFFAGPSMLDSFVEWRAEQKAAKA